LINLHFVLNYLTKKTNSDAYPLICCIIYKFITQTIGVAIESTSPSTSWKANGSQAPTEDRYAALKDLDCLMKSQVQQDTPPQLNNSNSSAWSK